LTNSEPFGQETLTKTLLPWEQFNINEGLPVRKKTILTAGFILMLFLIAIAEAFFVNFAQANPYMYHEWVSPPEGATPLEISVSSPKNSVVYNASDITLAFSVSTRGTSLDTIYAVYFNASWMEDNVTVYKQNTQNPEFPTFWSYNETFWDLPDGEYSVVITARGGGGYAEGLTAYSFDMTTISVVNFTIATPPVVSILSPLNETYGSSEVILNLAVDKSFSKITYVLDCQGNMTIDGNATLTGLSDGLHNVTVYAWDDAGNIGSSETVFFIVDVAASFPAMSVSAVSVASAATVGVGLLLYWKKRRREVEQA
jgi:hypothetical protein